MFHSARIKLTLWYLLIIMTVSIAFSIFIYIGASREFDRILRLQRYRIDHPNDIISQVRQEERPQAPMEIEVMEEAKMRTLAGLFGVNIIILLLSSLAGYFLAGLTLKPIKKMVDEQNQFVTDASHELRTPLTSLRTEIEVALRSNDVSIVHAKKLLASNLEDVIALQTLSDRLLELSAQQDSSFLTSVFLPEAIQSAVKTVTGLAKIKNIAIKKDVDDLHVQGIQSSIVEVFVIILDNAIKYSPSKSTIHIHAKKDADMISVTVQDNGIGVSEEDLPHLFDRFYRANKSRSKMDTSGYGLGLSIAQKIMKVHNGIITVASSLNKGTIVTMKFQKA